jgi:hypothetical protein
MARSRMMPTQSGEVQMPDEIVVTPEMIEAGVIAELEWLKKLPMTEATTPRMTAIYLAMRGRWSRQSSNRAEALASYAEPADDTFLFKYGETHQRPSRPPRG